MTTSNPNKNHTGDLLTSSAATAIAIALRQITAHRVPTITRTGLDGIVIRSPLRLPSRPNVCGWAPVPFIDMSIGVCLMRHGLPSGLWEYPYEPTEGWVCLGPIKW